MAYYQRKKHFRGSLIQGFSEAGLMLMTNGCHLSGSSAFRYSNPPSCEHLPSSFGFCGKDPVGKYKNK